MMTALPFSDFLETLRAKGFGVGLHEHLALGKLLARWDTTDRDELRNAIAALVARGDEEVVEIRTLFDVCYPREVHREEPPGGDDEVHLFRLVRLLRSTRGWVAVLSIASAIGLAVVGRVVANPALPSVPAPPTLVPPAPRTATAPTLGVIAPSLIESPAVSLPPPDQRVRWPALRWLGGLTLAVALLSLWGRRLRNSARRWTMDAWESTLAALPGPFHAPLVLKDLVTRLPRADVEEAATVLGRSFSRDRPGTILDIRESLRRTLKSGLQPHLVFRPRRVPQAILVLQDVSQSMTVHTARVDGLCRDLQRQGIVLDRWFFDGDVSQPSRRRLGAPVALDALLRAREEGPVMILSAGDGVPATLAGSDRTWLDAMRKQMARVWVNPVLDPKLWPAALQRLPLLVVPMTRAGLLQAAKMLARDDRLAGAALGHALRAPQPVTSAHVEQLRRLASLVPYPTPELVELLRQQFAPEIPETAVLYAVDRQAAGTGLPFRMSDEEIRNRHREIRTDAPALEARVRRYLLKVLGDSEPPAGSAAHLRWEASVAIHRVQLAEIEGTDGGPAIDALQQLYRGPLWEEIRAIVARQSSEGPVTTQLRAAVKVKRRPDPPAFVGRGDRERISRLRWRAPGWREVAAAAMIALLVTAGAAFTPPFRGLTDRLADAYVLEYVPGPGGEAGDLQIRTGASARTVPSTVDLYSDSIPGDANLVRVNAPISLQTAGPTAVALPSPAAHVYQARAVLPDGTLALSNALWAPSLVIVIDVQPWARLSISTTDRGLAGFGIQSAETPVALRLPPGRYQVQCENGGLTGPPLTQMIDVAPGGQTTFRFDMPGFSVNDVLRNLSSPKGQAKKY